MKILKICFSLLLSAVIMVQFSSPAFSVETNNCVPTQNEERYDAENDKTYNEEKDEKAEEESKSKKYIRYIDFTPTAKAMTDCANIDISGYGKERHLSWIYLLAYLSQKYGGDFSKYEKKHLLEVCEKAKNEEISSLAKNQKLYNYYVEAYTAILGGFIGEYRIENSDGISEKQYGVCAYSPIAAGYSYNHYDDFGASRSYGYRRAHLGHDIMGSLGTPIIAVEGGYVEAIGWNQYGGWRVGIRSFDGLRYYYYAHLRKDHPYAGLELGQIVQAGEVVGYMGMTGYSAKKNVNNINVVHLHYGLEIIFDPSQKDGVNQIWTDMYEITKFLSSYRSRTYYDSETNEIVALSSKRTENMPD